MRYKGIRGLKPQVSLHEIAPHSRHLGPGAWAYHIHTRRLKLKGSALTCYANGLCETKTLDYDSDSRTLYSALFPTTMQWKPFFLRRHAHLVLSLARE